MENKGGLLKMEISAEVYLSQRYKIPENLPELPLSDEAYIELWQEKNGAAVLDFLAENFSLPVNDFSWENAAAMSIFFTGTLAGRLPVIVTKSHSDLCCMASLVNGLSKPVDWIESVNAVTTACKSAELKQHRLIIVNYSPYSSISAERLKLSEADWLEKSQRLRVRHESLHYETLRILGGMKNHAMDELLADGLGQIEAFGSFSAERQRIFFGLEKGKAGCTGRLQHYCTKVPEAGREKIFQTVNECLDKVEAMFTRWQAEGYSDIMMIKELAAMSLNDLTIRLLLDF